MKKLFTISAILNAVFIPGFIIAMVLLGKSCNRECPPQSVSTSREVRDSMAPPKDTTNHVVFSKPKLERVGKVKHVLTASSQINFPEVNCIEKPANAASIDTNFYEADTTATNNYKASYHATVTGNKLVAFQLSIANLAPEHFQTVTVTKTILQKEKDSPVRFYIGAFATIRNNYWGIGAKANLAISERFLIGYGFDVKNQVHEAEFLISPKFK